MNRIYWSADGWPVLTNDWSAFYPFNTDAREHLGLYNGTLQNQPSITNEPFRGNVLNLDGVTNYVSLPLSVANASTFAAWVKWRGGADWQRIFDFGTGTSEYFFLTPRAYGGLMRFAITTNGNNARTADQRDVRNANQLLGSRRGHTGWHQGRALSRRRARGDQQRPDHSSVANSGEEQLHRQKPVAAIRCFPARSVRSASLAAR